MADTPDTPEQCPQCGVRRAGLLPYFLTAVGGAMLAVIFVLLLDDWRQRTHNAAAEKELQEYRAVMAETMEFVDELRKRNETSGVQLP